MAKTPKVISTAARDLARHRWSKTRAGMPPSEQGNAALLSQFSTAQERSDYFRGLALRRWSKRGSSSKGAGRGLR